MAAPCSSAKTITVRPVDTGVALCNPGMGWVFHHFDNSLNGYGKSLGPGPAGKEFPGLTVAYLRLAWAHLEPTEGEFHWEIVDTPAQRYLRAGKKIAFRFTCFESGEKYATPEWVKDLGAKGYWWNDGVAWEPDYDDPVFLEKLDHFLAAAGARYDGNPNVAFVDVGTIGIWGEGHPCTKEYGFETLKRHIDLHRRHFPNTLLAAQDDWSHHFHDFDFRQPGTHAVPLTFDAPVEARGKAFAVKAGIWIPHDTTRPEGRLLPASGDPDRRVPLGTLRIDDDGSASFDAVEVPAGTGGQFRVAPGKLRRLGLRTLLDCTWEVREPLPPNSQIFCHLERNGVIAFAAWPFLRDKRPLDYARSVGCTLRDDSILVQGGAHAYLSEWLAPDFWPDRPVILESGHYGHCKKMGTWGDGSRYLDAVEDYRASYVSIHASPPEFLRENVDLIARTNRRLGYRLNLVEATRPDALPAGALLEMALTWRTAGVAPCSPGGNPAVTLVNEREEIVAVLVDEGLNVRDLAVGPAGEAKHVTRQLRFPLSGDLTSGKLDVRVSVGDRFGTPTLSLPLAGDDGTHRYSLGMLTLLGEYAVTMGEHRVVDGELILPLSWTVHVALPEGAVPFCHLDLDGEILAGCPVSVTGNLTRHGEVAGEVRLRAPAEHRGKTLTVKTGLWKDGDATRLWGRMVPDVGERDRRAVLGTVWADDAGEIMFQPTD